MYDFARMMDDVVFIGYDIASIRYHFAADINFQTSGMILLALGMILLALGIKHLVLDWFCLHRK